MSRPIVRPKRQQLELARSLTNVVKPNGTTREAKLLGHVHPFAPHVPFQRWLERFMDGLTVVFSLRDAAPGAQRIPWPERGVSADYELLRHSTPGSRWETSTAARCIRSLAVTFQVCPLCVVSVLGDPSFHGSPSWFEEMSRTMLLPGLKRERPRVTRDEALFVELVMWAVFCCRGARTPEQVQRIMSSSGKWQGAPS